MNKTVKQEAIKKCLEAREKAILIPTSTTKVGACLYNEHDYGGENFRSFWEGYNIQNRSHKSYHAEEMAVLSYITSVPQVCVFNPFARPQGLIVSFSATIEKITFCCGHCRQTLWEYLRNPDLLVTEVDLEGNIVAEKTLKELYPDPYPR
jgi:cytidine deaminase